MDKISFRLEAFEGPLDLLLYLISKNKLSICEIRITDLLGQYLECVTAMQEEDMDVKSEFLEMASRLVYIKSVYLLPKHDEAEKLEEELVGELIEYELCRKLAGELSQMTDGFNTFVREPMKLPPQKGYKLKHSPDELLSFYYAAVGRGQRKLPPPAESFSGIVSRKIISVSSKIVYVMRNLRKRTKIAFKSLFEKADSRSELVATFLAVLELIKGRRVEIEGDGDNAEIKMIGGE